MAKFVGRTAELYALKELRSAALTDGGVRVAMVVGDPGIGKSRLIQESTSDLRPGELYPVTGHEPERIVPLAAAGPLLRRLSETPETGELLGRLLLGDGSSASTLEPIRLFEVAHRCLDSSKAVLTVDDLQWLDEMTIALSHYLIRAASQPLFVLAAARPSPTADGFAEALAETLRDRFVRIDLGPLDRDSAEELLRGISDDIDDRRAVELWRQTKGSPFWLESLARASTADDMHETIRNRTATLSGDASKALTVLAVVGRPVSIDDAVELLEWPQERAHFVLDELSRRGLAVVGAGGCRVAHDLIREALLARMSPALMRPVHRAVAAQLEARAEGDLAILQEALEHRRAAGLPSLPLALEVARSSARRLLGSESLELLTQIAHDEGEAGLDLHWEVASMASEMEEHRTALDRWTMLSERVADHRRRAEAALAASRAASELDEVDYALGLVRRARALVPNDQMFGIMLDSHEATVLRWQANRLAEADELTDRALASARALIRDSDLESIDERERRAYIEALQSGFEAAFPADRPAESLMLTEEMLRVASRDEVSYLRAAHVNGVCLAWNGRLREAAERLRAVWSEARRLALPGLAADAGHSLSNVLHDLGELREAAAVLDEALAIGHRLEFKPGQTYVMRHFITAVNDWRRAVEDLEADAAKESNPHSRLGLYEARASFLARYEGKTARPRVAELLSAAMADLETTGCRRCGRELLVRSAEAYARVGMIDESRDRLERWDAYEEPSEPGSDVWRAHAGGLLDHARGDVSGAVAQLEEALSHARRMGFVMDELQVLTDLAGVYEETDRERATALLEEVATRTETMGALTLQRAAERRLRRLGVRVWRRSGAGSGDAQDLLTDREREVAALAAEGAKNAEIARSLFLSPKTVERHLSNVFTKLGVRNRAELGSRFGAQLTDGGSVPGR